MFLNPEIRNPKSEIRNKSKVRKTKIQNGLYVCVLVIQIYCFEFVSDFVLRI